METIVSRTLSVHKEHEVLLKLEAAGLCDALAQKVIDSKDNVLAQMVIRLIANGGFEPSTSQKRAREIMGRNFFGVEEAITHFGVNPSKQQIAYLAEVPFSEEVLASCKDTHVLAAVFPMSILDIRGKVERKLFCSHDDAWYNKQVFRFGLRRRPRQRWPLRRQGSHRLQLLGRPSGRVPRVGVCPEITLNFEALAS